MNPHFARVSLRAITLAVGISSLAAQTTVNIVCDRDNTLYEDAAGTLSNGQGFLFCGVTGSMAGPAGKRRALLHFNVGGNVPAGAVIISADLRLFVQQSSAFLAIPTDVHRVLQNWGEGASLAAGNGGGGTNAATGDATWIHTFFPSSLWNNAGGDYATMASFTFPLASLGVAQTLPEPGLIADVQSWLDNPTQNFGWLLKTNELLASTARRIDSRSASFAPNRPTLNVTYLLPGETGSIGTGCPVGAGTLDLSLNGTAAGGNTVQILYSNAPAPSIGVDFFSLGIDPIGTPLFPNCRLYLPISLPFVGGAAFLTSGGLGNSSFIVPIGFPGFLVAVQGAVLDMTPLTVSLSNAGVMLTQ